MAVVLSDFCSMSMLNDVMNHTSSGGYSGVLNGTNLSVELFQNNVSINHQTTLLDLTPATFEGYALQSGLTWESLYRRSDGSLALNGSICEFSCTGSATPNTIYGYFVFNSSISGVPLLMSELFDTPKNISSAPDAVLVSPQFALGLDNDYGSGSFVD